MRVNPAKFLNKNDKYIRRAFYTNIENHKASQFLRDAFPYIVI
jgi:hypothetical protein